MSASNAPAVSIRTDGTDGIVFGEGAGVRTFVVVLLYYHSLVGRFRATARAVVM